MDQERRGDGEHERDPVGDDVAAAGEGTSNTALTPSMPKMPLVAEGGSEVPVPPPSCVNRAVSGSYPAAPASGIMIDFPKFIQGI